MAIDFFDLEDKNRSNLIFQIEEDDLLTVDETLIKLEKLTGVFVDAYGITKMHPDHVKLWFRLLEEFANNTSVSKSTHSKVINSILNFVKNSVRTNSGLLIIGD